MPPLHPRGHPAPLPSLLFFLKPAGPGRFLFLPAPFSTCFFLQGGEGDVKAHTRAWSDGSPSGGMWAGIATDAPGCVCADDGVFGGLYENAYESLGDWEKTRELHYIKLASATSIDSQHPPLECDSRLFPIQWERTLSPCHLSSIKPKATAAKDEHGAERASKGHREHGEAAPVSRPPISSAEGPLDVLEQRVLFTALLTFGSDLAVVLSLFALGNWEVARDALPLSIIPSPRRAILELNVYILFIPTLKSKPDASEEKKTKDKCTVKGEELQVTD